ncbi:MAG: type I pantothenate kinase [Myxococcaceae bacterium]|nr:type I pantothenate kinase [Myxococcaceae bacterium]MCI0669430.1 type I pantothenate kinase [Myxococcaceae bacterium]
MTLSLYHRFTSEEWSRLRASTPLTLTQEDVAHLQGITERLSLDEVVQVYLPLSRLLSLYVQATQGLHQATRTFLGTTGPKVPYILGIAGSVAVGKSTTARVLQALLARWPSHPRVDLVTTDGFLYPNAVLQERGLMQRKGFPESYDLPRLLEFLAAVKSGAPEAHAPVYSHHAYDIVPGQTQAVRQPEVLILEGLNVLQSGAALGRRPVFVSDFFDFTIYVDADERHIEKWYVERFQMLLRTAFQDPTSYFHSLAGLGEEASRARAKEVWRTINGLNLRENILPTRERAHLVLVKGERHEVREVRLRKL